MRSSFTFDVENALELGIRGKNALVCAASRGIGRACALALAAEGARVAICARDEESLRRTASEIAAETGGPVGRRAARLRRSAQEGVPWLSRRFA